MSPDRSRSKDVKGAEFFALLLQNTQEGFFADPIYGGNRDMAGWKLVGFPGARYDYRDWVERHNEALSAAARQHHGSLRLDSEGIVDGAQTPAEGRRDHRPRMDRIDPRL